MRFWLGTHVPNWLSKTTVDLFVSHRTLSRYKGFPWRATCSWALDSGGFTELGKFGRWVTTEAEYIAAARIYMAEIGGLAWASPQDWMCEPFMLDKTGLTVDEHQRRTVDNLLSLRMKAPDVPWIPVLQGWQVGDYHRCVERYEKAGVALDLESVVGVGSVCRRQGTSPIEAILTSLSVLGLRLHGFGVKKGGLRRYAHSLASADSMAWSYAARMAGPQEGCPHGRPVPLHLQDVAGTAGRPGGSCSNCLRYALRWRADLLRDVPPQQLSLGVPA